MQEFTSPGEIPVADREVLTDALWRAAKVNPARPAVAYRDGDQFVEWTTAQFADEVRAVAKGMAALGIARGDKVAIYSGTRLEWTVLDFAIWAVGAITVPIYETSSSDQVGWIMSDAAVRAIVVESAALRETFDQVADSLTDCEHVLMIDGGGLDALKQGGASVNDEDLDARTASMTGADTATIVYTSGTTGRPKGCVINHYNFIWEAEQVAEAAKEFFRPGKRTLLFLPLAHIFARVIQTCSMRQGVLIAYSSGVPQLLEELEILKPEFLVAVPRVFEKVYNGARQKAYDEGKGKIFDQAARVAEQYSRQKGEGRVSPWIKTQHALFDKLVYRKLRAALGGEVRHVVSGGSALGERLGHFFNGIGVIVLEGYGLTETTAGACLASPSAYKIGTVGRPVPGASVRISAAGELLIKGGLVFQGYYNNPQETTQVLDEDGWFHTGDLAHLDEDGFVRITGRIKELLVTSGGKNVAPAVLEDRMRAHALVSQSMVVGDGRPFIAAVITIDREAFASWTAEQGREGATVADLADDPELRAQVQKAVDEANASVSKAESIREFRILPDDFTVGVELSQKMSVKRHVVAEKYHDVIAGIYGDTER